MYPDRPWGVAGDFVPRRADQLPPPESEPKACFQIPCAPWPAVMPHDPGRPFKRADISDGLVLEVAHAFRDQRLYPASVRQSLINMGYPAKVVDAKLEQMIRDRKIGCGPSLNYIWPEVPACACR